MTKLKQEYGEFIKFYAVSFNNTKEINSIKEKYNFDFTHLILDKDDIIELSIYGGFPTNVFVSDGFIIDCHFGGPPSKDSSLHEVMIEELFEKYKLLFDSFK